MSRTLRLVQASIAVSIICITTQQLALAQEADTQLASDVVSLFVKATNFDVSLTPRYAASRQLLQLSRPLLVPNLYSENVEFRKQLLSLDNVPSIESGSVRLGDTPNTAALSSLKGTITLAPPIISDLDVTEANVAKSILFNRNGLPTSGYVLYLSYEEKYNTKLAALKAETAPQSQQQLRAELSMLEREWEAIGDRSTFAAAVKQYERSNRGADQAHVEQWLDEIQPMNVATFIDVAIETASWIRVSQSGALNSTIHISSKNESGEDMAVKRISFDATVVWLDRPYISDGFLLDRGWKTTSTRPVSVGDGATTENSLLPDIVAGLLIVKNVEIFVSSELDRKSISILRAGTTVDIDGISVESHGGTPLILQRQMIGLPELMIVGAVVDGLKKIPDPDPDRRWPD